MISSPILKKKLGSALVPTVGLCLVLYFAFHAVQGERSIFARERLTSDIADARETLEALRSEREHLQHRVELLMPDGLDLDMLNERARSVLGYTHPHDVILLHQGPPAATPR